MTPQRFIETWKNSKLSERAGAQLHFNDLCDLLGVDKPSRHGEYQFEYGASKVSGGEGWADVWKQGFFGWENKKPGRDLKAALKQLLDYAPALGFPPLLVVCDRRRIEIHTAFNGYPDEPKTVLLDDIGDPVNLQLLRWVFTDPERLKPAKSSAAITEEAAGKFADLATVMRDRGEDPHRVAHFLNQCLFCMFAEDEGLLPGKVFEHLLTNAKGDGAVASARLQKLFTTMRKGGDYGDNAIAWFNGGLFKTIDVPSLGAAELSALEVAAREMDWRAIEPAIFGTLFERGLNPNKRSQLGAHYTDTQTIMRIIDPVIVGPLLAEWDVIKAAISESLGKSKKIGDKAYKGAEKQFHGFLERLRNFTVLDPACGSGNFLYLALKSLKDLEKRANLDAEMLGLQRQVSIEVSPANVLGIELDPYAAELARVTVWIGEIQWMLKNGYALNREPILKPLDHVENRDALLNGDGTEAAWPASDVVVGNPPFVGDKKMIGELGAEYVEILRGRYDGRVPGGADLVCYWFEKSNDLIRAGKLQRGGLVATNSIRGGRNREVLKHVCDAGRIFNAWSDEEWINEGAAVRVSLVCFGRSDVAAVLNDAPAGTIFPDLTAAGADGAADLTKAKSISQNFDVSFQGVTPSAQLQRKRREELGLPEASFNLDGETARRVLREPANVRGEPMSDVVRPYWIADDITSRSLDRFIVNFGDRDELSASMFERPFAAIANVRLHREHARRNKEYPWWWLLWPRPVMFKALRDLPRFISIPRVSKHHLCVWAPSAVAPGDALVVVARSDETTLGILQSRIHERWAQRTGTQLGVGNDPRYTHTTCFETFPFPEGLAPNVPAADYAADLRAVRIADAARKLVEARDRWLNPPEWTERVPEVVPGYPDRIVAKAGHETDLKKRTLTNLYNERPAWLANLHRALDEAVAAAYAWEWPLSDDQVLRRLFVLNQSRAAAEAAAKLSPKEVPA